MVAAAIDWSNLTVAAAFMLGAVAATVATLRIVRAVTAMFERVDDRHRRRPYRRPERDDDVD